MTPATLRWYGYARLDADDQTGTLLTLCMLHVLRLIAHVRRALASDNERIIAYVSASATPSSEQRGRSRIT